MAVPQPRTRQVPSTPPSSDDTVSDSRDVSESFESFPDRVEEQMRIAIEKGLRQQQQRAHEHLPERKVWGTDVHLVLACLGIAMGMGNIWRFPKAVYENGGGSFLIAYTVMMVVVGYPLFYLELILGQYTRLGPSAVTRCVPLAKGVEVGMGLVGFIMAIYFNVVLAQSVLHLFLTFIELNLTPVSGCYGFWEKEVETCYRMEKKICTERQQNAPPVIDNLTRANMRRAVASDPHYLRPYHYDDSIMDCVNVTESMNEHFFHVSIGMNNHDVGSVIGLQPELAICLGLSWALLFTCISTGFTITRKKGSLMPLVPVGMVVLLMVGTLWESGAGYGLLYLLIPKWEKLADVTVWSNAVTQLLFSLGLAYGPVLVYGSFNRFYTDIHRATFTVIGLSYVASIMYSIIVFSSLGRLSYSLNIPVESAVHGGQSIMFVAMNKYSMHWILSSVFFVLVVIAGTTSQVAGTEVAMTHLSDLFPTVRFNNKPFALLYCFAGCTLGLPLVTEGGLYLLHMMDSQVTGFLLSYVALFELGAVIWIYGLEHLRLDVMLMHGELTAMKLEYAWTIGVPLILAGNIVSSLLTGCSSLRFGPILYPVYSCYIGWTFIIIGALQVPLWAIVVSYNGPKRLDQCLLPDSCQEFNLNSQSGSEPLAYQHHP